MPRLPINIQIYIVIRVLILLFSSLSHYGAELVAVN